jgi:hypothetical protein
LTYGSLSLFRSFPLIISAGVKFWRLRDEPSLATSCPGLSGLFGPVRHTEQTNDCGNNASNEHPDGLVSRRIGKEPGKIGSERACRIESKDNEHNSAND